jgi:hypothetical protein
MVGRIVRRNVRRSVRRMLGRVALAGIWVIRRSVLRIDADR